MIVRAILFMSILAAVAGGFFYFATPGENIYEIAAEKELGKIRNALINYSASKSAAVIQSVLDPSAKVHLDIYRMQTPGPDVKTSYDLSRFQFLNYIQGILGHARNYSFEPSIIQASFGESDSGVVQFNSTFDADILNEWGSQTIGHYAMSSRCNTHVINAGKREYTTINGGTIDPTRLGNLSCSVKVKYTPAATTSPAR